MTNRLQRYGLSPQLSFEFGPTAVVNTSEAATMLGCSMSTIIRMIEDGTLDGVKRRKNRPKSHYMVTRESIHRVAAEWRHDAGLPAAQTTATTPATAPASGHH